MEQYYARSSIGPLIAKARAADMLTPAHPGKASGDLTPTARQLLTTANFQAPWYPPPARDRGRPSPASLVEGWVLGAAIGGAQNQSS